ncbi:hypothetical protein [Flavobacterium sp.]|uniref:hypothetical protein n=1 Tax=Flavobacterium sp. TaxID=239 RepID=UPI00260E429F|nr:hypothetical protein [Flavobacterium sp.]
MKFLLRVFLLFTALSTSAQQIDALPINWSKRTQNAKVALFADSEQKNLYVLANNQGRLKVLRYNSALFLRDSVSYRVNETFQKDMVMTFENDSVFIHAINETENRVLTVKTDTNFETYRMGSNKLFDEDEISLVRFQDGDRMHFLVVNKKSKSCFVYTLQGNNLTKKLLNTAVFDNFNGKELFTDFLRKGDFAEINDQFTPFMETIPADKCFFKSGKARFLRTRNGKASIQEIDFNEYSARVESFDSKIQEPANYAAFLGKKELFETSVNKDSLVLIVTDLQTKKQIKRFQIEAKTEAKNSDFMLYEQRNEGNPRPEYQAKRFLRRLSQSQLGISVYESLHGKLITIGGVDSSISAGGIILSAAAAVTEFDTGADFYENSILFISELATDVFLQPKKYKRCIPAIDEILQFNTENKVEISAIAKFRNIYIQAAFIPADQTLNVSKFQDRD